MIFLELLEKLASKLGPVGTALTTGVIAYEINTEAWMHTQLSMVRYCLVLVQQL